MRTRRNTVFMAMALATTGFFACSKDSTPGTSGPSVNQATFDGSTVDFSTVTTGTLSSKNLVFYGVSGVQGTTSLSLGLASLKALKTGTYSSADTTLSSFYIYSRINGKKYSSHYSDNNTITLTAIDSASASFAGSYSAKLYADSSNVAKTITGTFKK
ncbi:hypothetical protein [Parasediminibacterium sp. JCM 36343]|uniref:hypothetical protein n=1 Tax=Parasediminibacterium sp. JCM 36343 TaxID=3374279 RepID=UPI00397E3CFA